MLLRMLVTATALAAIPLLGAKAAPTEIIDFNGGLVSSFIGTNPTATTTLLSVNNDPVTFVLFGSSATAGIMDLTASNTDSAISPGGIAIQHFSGSFCITSGPGCSGTNFLSGTYADAALGALGGDGLTINVANPPEALSFTSSVIPAADLKAPTAFDISMSAVNPPLAVANGTIEAFTASFTGDASSSVTPTPEPSTLVVLLAGIVGLGAYRLLPKGKDDAA